MSSSGPPGARLQSADWPQRSQFSAQLRPSSGMKVRRAVIGADKLSGGKKKNASINGATEREECIPLKPG